MFQKDVKCKATRNGLLGSESSGNMIHSTKITSMFTRMWPSMNFKRFTSRSTSKMMRSLIQLCALHIEPVGQLPEIGRPVPRSQSHADPLDAIAVRVVRSTAAQQNLQLHRLAQLSLLGVMQEPSMKLSEP